MNNPRTTTAARPIAQLRSFHERDGFTAAPAERGQGLLDLDARIRDVVDPAVRILLQAPPHEAMNVRGERRRQRRPVGLPLQDGRNRVRDRVARERAPARQHLVEDAAERPVVRALVDRLAARLLGAHVRAGAENHAGTRHVGIRGRGGAVGAADAGCRAFRQAEIEQLHAAFRRDLHVRRLHVAMDDAFAVCGRERLGEVARNSQRFRDRHGTGREAVGERRPFDQFEDEHEAAIDLLDAMDRADVGMVQRRKQS